jgi:hypothetical protein
MIQTEREGCFVKNYVSMAIPETDKNILLENTNQILTWKMTFADKQLTLNSVIIP